MIVSSSIDKSQFRWLVNHFGYSFGFFGAIKWNKIDTNNIIDEWAKRYQVSHFISGFHFLSSNLQIDANDYIVNELILRTIIRPAWGSPPQIPNKPLPDKYEQLINQYFRT